MWIAQCLQNNLFKAKTSRMKIKPSYAGRSQPTKQSSSPRDLPTLRAHQDQREPNDNINDNNNNNNDDDDDDDDDDDQVTPNYSKQ